MSVYSYEAINFAGKTVNGEMQAPNRSVVVEHLHKQGYILLAADEKSAARFALTNLKSIRFPKTKKLSLNDIVFLTQELALMLRAGLTLERSLSVMASLTEQAHIVRFLNSVHTSVCRGASFADALAAQAVTLPAGYIGMIRAGEAGGGEVLNATLERLSDHLKHLQKIRERLFSAMLYPAIVLVMAAMSIILILFFVLPQFEPLFESARDALPSSTKFLLATAHGLRIYWWMLLILTIGLVVMLRALLKLDSIKLKCDGLLLKLPKLGKVIVKVEMAKFCNTLGVLLTNGVTPIHAISIAVENFSNRKFWEPARKMVEHVREGEMLSTAMKREPMFPTLSLQMISIGEETGQLETMLIRTAEIYDREVQRSLERFMTLLAPLTTILLGIVIASIIGSVLSAILSIDDMVN